MRSQGRAEIAFKHGIHGFALPALAIGGLVGAAPEAVVHVAAVPPGGGLGRWPPRIRRDDRADAQIRPRDAVIGLRIVAGIGDDGLEVGPPPGIDEQRLEEALVGPAAGCGAGGEDQVATGGHRQRELGQSPHHA